MHILYLSHYYPPEVNAPANRVSQFARAWVQEGHGATILTGFPNHPMGIIPPEYRGRPYVRREHDAGVTVVRAPIYAAPNRGVVRRSLSYISYGVSASTLGPFITGKPDIVIATTPQFLTAVSGYWLATLKRVPFVLEVRDLWPRSIVDLGAMRPGTPMIRLLEAAEIYLYRRSNAIIVVTDSFADEIAKQGIPREKIAVIKNGVNLKLFRPGVRENAVRARLGLTGKFVAAYIGTHGLAHGLGTLLDAAALLQGDDRFRFILMGEGAEKPGLVARAKAQGLSNIIFVDQQRHEDVPEYITAVNVGIVLLRGKELFKNVIPSKIFEFMAAGRPILLGVDGEARQIVEGAGAGVFVSPETPTALAAGLRELAASPERVQEMGARGRAHVEANFSDVALARGYLDILCGILRRRGAVGEVPIPPRGSVGPHVADHREFVR